VWRTEEKNTHHPAQLQPLVEKFVADLEQAFRQSAMQAVQASLSGIGLGGARGSAGTRGAPVAAKRGPGRPPKAKGIGGAPKKAKSAGRIGRRSPAEIEATTHKVLAYIKAHPNARAEDIKKAVGIGKAEWLLPIQRLLETKQVTSKGERRATTYTAK